jgi:Zn-dependent protease
LKEAFYIIPILFFSIIVHEIAHGWVALKCGDPTARDAGRITFNPIPHIDLFGTIVLPLIFVFSNSSFFLAWAKPVPVNPNNYYNPRRDDLLVSIAGPASNLLMAFFCCVGLIIMQRIIPESEPYTFSYYIIRMFAGGITLNIFLAVFNLLPIPPLDGSHVLASFLPDSVNYKFQRVGFLGVFILLFFLQVPEFRRILFAIVRFILIPYEYFLNLFL